MASWPVRCRAESFQWSATSIIWGWRRDADIVHLEQRLGDIVGTATRIDYSANHGRGRISFTFHSLEALEGILERLGYRED